MKILEISFHLHPGGAERFVTDLSNELSKTNDVILLTLRDDKAGSDNRLFYKSELYSTVNYSCLGLQDGLRPSMWRKIWKAIRLNNPDIVHFHGDPMMYWMFIPILFSSHKIKFVQTIHSDFHWGKYDSGINRIAAYVFGRTRQLRYVALAEKNYEDLTAFYPNIMSECIINGRAELNPTTEFEAVKKEINAIRRTNNTKIFLHIARCSEVKNQTRLIVNFNRLIHDGADAQLLIIGDGFNDGLGLSIRSIASDNVHFLGIKSNIADYQILSDVFCLSSDAEGMPITLLEALLSGTPVVSTPVCGALSAIQNYKNGILAEDFSDDAYYSALRHIYENLAEITESSMRIKSDCPFTIKACAEKYIHFFNK